MAAPKGFTMQGFGDYKDCEVASGLKARDYKDATDLVTEAKPVVLDRAFFNQGQNAKYDPQFYTDGTVPTLVARGSAAVQVQYIVRRLTPTECARLQGFPDWWGHIAQKDDLTDEEYRFWLDVRNTHAKINDKPEKDYTKAQMLSWYNKLHTDSAEYKMWGNGIALPPALYCMQGIMEVLNAEKAREETTEEAMSEIMEETTEETIEAESPLHDRNDSIDSRNYAFIALQALNTDTPEEEQRDPALPEEDNIMEEKEDELMDPTTIHAPADRELREQTAQTAEQAPEGFDAVERLYQLKDEREKLANLTGNTRFADDARALGYAITVLEAVGL